MHWVQYKHDRWLTGNPHHPSVLQQSSHHTRSGSIKWPWLDMPRGTAFYVTLHKWHHRSFRYKMAPPSLSQVWFINVQETAQFNSFLVVQLYKETAHFLSISCIKELQGRQKMEDAYEYTVCRLKLSHFLQKKEISDFGEKVWCEWVS